MSKMTEKVFTGIYRQNTWGGAEGEFCSGPGSVDDGIVSAYIAAISAQASSEGFLGRAFVDLGCGDFRVARRLIPLCSSYTGIDIVKPLVRQNQERYGNGVVCFMHLDIVDDSLPDGDVCFLRQVLQHLSNYQIVAILQKLTKYRWVFITEHYPTDNDAIEPNIDKFCGGGTRVSANSGVYLTKPPFRLPADALEQVLEVRGVGSDESHDQGLIRTFLYEPGNT